MKMLETLLINLFAAVGIDQTMIKGYADAAMIYMQNYDTRLASIEARLADIEAALRIERQAAPQIATQEKGDTHAR
jgi:hypothetical protein